MNPRDTREKLLGLSIKEKKERKKILKDLLFYRGECEEENKEAAVLDNDLLGQSWINTDDLDYVPSQVIDNKVKPLIGKQARFMFGKSPDLLLKPFDKENKESCEKLRQYIDAILKANRFWSDTLKAFRLATVTKRVMLRLEANPKRPIKLYYHDFNDFSYELDSNDSTKLNKAIIVKQDASTANKEESKQIWNRYTYSMVSKKDKESSCFLKTEIFNGNDLDKPTSITEQDTGLRKVPCWVIINEQCLSDPNGISDIKDLIPLQNQINRRTSDSADAIRFDMFGLNIIKDATEDSVNAAKIAPNSLLALVSLSGKTADAKKIESTFQNAAAAENFIKRLEDSMSEKLSIPKPEQLTNIPSAKTLKFVYSELVSRCDEKWHDWEPTIRSMIRLMVEASGQFKCYDDWDGTWNDLLYNIVIRKNYPVPEDEDDKHRIAMEEVNSNVRSHRSYIKDFTEEENTESIIQEIAEDITTIVNAEQGQMVREIDVEDT
ncbi:phage portal protein [Clostridium estertheticum]|uniref:phage portal protein n=1 Tax=Clostridium estertheticum TaxID=238834 RepID=UPI001C0CD8D4|nr:phage portal protein [Clostridium estertheticum]MBU3185647.1 phage portal protein [Clostridium estertheticum]